MAFWATQAAAQNILSNGSFEQKSACPFTAAQVTSNCINWRSFTSGGSPDYMHACAASGPDVPTNYFGTQAAAHDSAYAGLIIYNPSSGNDFREYLATSFPPLQVGAFYELSMSVSVADASAWGANGLACWFYDVGSSTITHSGVIPVTPQVSYANYGPLQNKTGWDRLVGTFQADSAYDNLVIGSFITNSASATYSFGSGNTYCYVYIDSVVLRLVSNSSINFTDSVFCAGDTINVPYSVSNTTYFASGNVFTLQLSGPTGSFAAPVNIGSVTSNMGGTIQAVLPATATGSGYRLRLVASNPADTSLVSPHNILIKPRPVPVAGTNAPVCAGGTLTLSATALPGSAYSWSGPSYLSAQQNNSILNAATAHSGDYIVTATLNGCSSKDTVTVLVKPMPAVPVAGNDGPLCAGDTLHLTAQSAASGVSYAWAGPASFGSGQQNPAINGVSAANGGTYTVTASINGCTSAAGSTTVVIKPKPATPSASSNSPVCAGGVLNLTANSSTSGVNYTWTGPVNFTSNQQNPSINPVALNAGGVYHVVAELNSCLSDTGKTTVAVNNVSSLGVYPSPNDTLCVNSPNATFVAVPFNAGTAPQYQWYKNGNLISGVTNISYPATGIADGDTFQCRMIVTGQCADPLTLFSNKIGMTVLPMTTGPSVTITADPPGQLKPWQLVKFTAVANNAGSDPKYQWKRNSQNVAGATAFTWSANNLSHNDTVTCEVTSSIWCANPPTAMSNRIDVNIALGIDEVNGESSVHIYPNPNNGRFSLLLTSSQGGGTYHVEVVNAIGQVVYRSQITNPASEIILPAVASGVYLLRVSGEKISTTARILIER